MTYRARVETLYLLGFSLDLVNMFIGTVAYPAIANDLHASVPQLAWIGNAYMLGLTLVIPLGSWLAARLGERRVLCLSLALFTVGAVLAGTAPSIEWLIAWRLMQGLGGGLLIPVGQAMAYRECPPSDRPHHGGGTAGAGAVTHAGRPAGGVGLMARRVAGQCAAGHGGLGAGGVVGASA